MCAISTVWYNCRKCEIWAVPEKFDTELYWWWFSLLSLEWLENRELCINFGSCIFIIVYLNEMMKSIYSTKFGARELWVVFLFIAVSSQNPIEFVHNKSLEPIQTNRKPTLTLASNCRLWIHQMVNVCTNFFICFRLLLNSPQ